jgi:predicted membrane chloride channel (bestrophin family)
MFKSMLQIINWKTLLITALAVLSTGLSRRYGLTGEFPLTLIGIAVVFPLVFSISGAYKRREAALAQYGSLKAHGRAIFFAARDWLPERVEDMQEKAQQLVAGLLASCRDLLHTPTDRMSEVEERAYAAFGSVSRFIKELRGHGLAGGEASRCNQYLSKMLIAFENVKHIYQYRTPRTLRAYSRFFIYILPVIYGPHFAEISLEFASGLEYVVPTLFSVLLVSLDNIQEHLENPFDQIGEDDVTINAEKFGARLHL